MAARAISSRGLPLQRHLKEKLAHAHDHGHIEHADEEVRPEFPQEQLRALQGGGHQAFHAAPLQLPHHRQGREQGPHHGHDNRNQAGDDVVAGLQVLVEPEPGLGVHRHLRPARPFAGEALRQEFLVVRRGHRLDVTQNDVGGVGIGAVHQGLALGGLPRLVLPGKIIRDHHARLNAAVPGSGASVRRNSG